jgi:ubiquinone/menaquinone biosynthesis C-methylase UbiE
MTMLRFVNVAAAAWMLFSLTHDLVFFRWLQVDLPKPLVDSPFFHSLWLVTSALALGSAPSQFVVRAAILFHSLMIFTAPINVVLTFSAFAVGMPGIGVTSVALAFGIGILVHANHREFVRRGLWRGLFVAKADKPNASPMHRSGPSVASSSGPPALPMTATTPLSAEMLAYYQARAPYYDAVYARPERAADIAFLAYDLPARLAGRRVLEVACGTGYWTQHIAPAARAVVATDAAQEPMQFARLRPALAAVEFVQADAYALPASLGQFDAAFAGLWLSHVPRQERGRFLASLHARLAPGARVVFIDNSEVQCRDLPIVERDAFGNTYQQRRLADGSVHRVLKNFPSHAELAQMLRGLGTVEEFRELDNFWLLAYRVT